MADNFYAKYPVGDVAAGVDSLNSLIGALTLVAGTNITITPGVGTLTIDASGGGGGGATTALDNLASTAVNADIVPALDNTVNLGSSSKGYQTVWCQGVESRSNASLSLEADGGDVFLFASTERVSIGSFGNDVAPTLALQGSDSSFFIGLKSPDDLAATQTYVLPAVDGNPGDILSTDGNGVLSWIAP